MSSIGDRWKSARQAAGLSAQQAADAIGVHRNTIYGLEKGEDGATLRLMSRVADLYGVTLGYIFKDEGQQERVPVEFRPLLEPLRPLDQAARESIIRNIAANLNFMSTLYAVGAQKPREVEEETISLAESYASQNNLSRDDAPVSIPLPPRALGDVAVNAGQNPASGNVGSRQVRRHAEPKGKKDR